MTIHPDRKAATVHSLRTDRPPPAAQRLSVRPGAVKWLFGGVALAVVLGAYWYANHRNRDNRSVAPLAVSVRVAPAIRGNMPVVERTIGTVVSNAMVQVTAVVPGPLMRAYFQEGQTVSPLSRLIGASRSRS
jgi:hypothetical protein